MDRASVHVVTVKAWRERWHELQPRPPQQQRGLTATYLTAALAPATAPRV
jgi:hypothetical protein